MIFIFPVALRPKAGHGLLILEVFRSHNDAAQSVELLWTSNQLVAQTSTRQHTTLTTDKHPCPRRDSNPRSQKAAELRLRPHGHRDRRGFIIVFRIKSDYFPKQHYNFF